jgi:uncharacterized short protein YbdD (DUF466 family)
MTGTLVWLRELAHAMVGIPSYRLYRAHMAERHPEATPMTERDFVRDRQQARYGGRGGGRCC